jgi:hypothetical protein
LLAEIIVYVQHIRAACYIVAGVEFVREKQTCRDGGTHLAWSSYSKRSIRYENMFTAGSLWI